MLCVTQAEEVVPIDFWCLKDYDFLATVLVGDGAGNGNGGRSTSNRFVIWMNQKVIVAVIAGATGISDIGGHWSVTAEFIRFSEKSTFFRNSWFLQ